MKIGVVGAGAMGSVYGGILGGAGNEVWLVDVWREHVDAIRIQPLISGEADGQRRLRRDLRRHRPAGGAGAVKRVEQVDLRVPGRRAYGVS